MTVIYCFYFWAVLMFCATSGWALSSNEVLVIANQNAADSVELARYYMARRNIPEDNLLVLKTMNIESCPRQAYNDQIARKVLGFLKKKDPLQKIRCLTTIYGIPLKIQPPYLSAHEQDAVAGLRGEMKALQEQLASIGKVDPAPSEKLEKIEKTLAGAQQRLTVLTKENQRAALDSELALVKLASYPLSGWVPNPLFIGFKDRLSVERDQILLVCRLDGPSPEIVRRIIDDSVAVEETGLAGIAYFDARWPKPADENKVEGYTLYDRSIHMAADRVRDMGRMKVVLDAQAPVFQPGQCPDAALYCGWYSLANYVDAFKWTRGAVGYHIASAECRTLKSPESQVWCKRMLEDGVAATIGPTDEPYVQAFPVPEIFFGLLVEGRLSLAECYALSTPFWSWQMVLIGDPLYRPFGK